MKEKKAGPVLMAVGKPGEPAVWIIPTPKKKINWFVIILVTALILTFFYLVIYQPM